VRSAGVADCCAAALLHMLFFGCEENVCSVCTKGPPGPELTFSGHDTTRSRAVSGSREKKKCLPNDSCMPVRIESASRLVLTGGGEVDPEAR
jgi:hypothetical protein